MTDADGLPHDIAGFELARMFQGWHIANMESASRTVAAYVPQFSDMGASILKHCMSQPGVRSEHDKEVIAARIRDQDNFSPIVVKVRGGSEYCATTLCDVNNFLVPSKEYAAAKLYVVTAVNRELLLKRKGLGSCKPNSFLALFKRPSLDDIDESWFIEPTFAALTGEVIEVSKRIIDSAAPQWQDPRSRAEARTQFDTLLRQLLRECSAPREIV